MAWPVDLSPWGDPRLFSEAQEAYLDVARAIARFEPVRILAPPAEVDSVRSRAGEGIEILPAELEFEWMRDHGPTFAVDRIDRRAVGIAWDFNGYGRRFTPFDKTVLARRALLERLRIERWDCPMVLEGGAVHWDGSGTLITTEECLLNPNRNPSMSREDIESTLAGYLGVRKVIWLPFGLEDDDTDGHVDEVAAFAGPAQVVALDEDDPSDGNFRRLKANLEVLESETDASGRRLDVIAIRQPRREGHPIHGTRLPLSYINSYIANGGLVMPSFGDSVADAAARERMADAFPGREVVQVDGLAITKGGGCIHCITQQQPDPGEAPEHPREFGTVG